MDAHGVITLDGQPGTLIIAARQSGNAFVNAAPVARLEIPISSKTRPTILFIDFKKEGPLPPVMLNSSPRIFPGVYSNNGKRIQITSSDPNILSVIGRDKFIARKTGVVELTFDVPPDDNFASALPQTRSIEVKKPTRGNWLENRRKDPRYSMVRNQFTKRKLRLNQNYTNDEAVVEFDLNSADSDGDGYSNLFERALGMDSLAFDRTEGPRLIRGASVPPIISFVRYQNPIEATGENFSYIVESSSDMVNWKTANVFLSSKIEIGEGVERVSYSANESNHIQKPLFLRVRIVSN